MGRAFRYDGYDRYDGRQEGPQLLGPTGLRYDGYDGDRRAVSD
jgi:hypothetical protein